MKSRFCPNTFDMTGPTRSRSEDSRNRMAGNQKGALAADRAAWRRFFLAILVLAFAFFLALYATALREAAHDVLAGAMALVSLLVAGVVALKVAPYLAHRTALEYWMARVKYEFTREGGLYLAIVGVIAVAALNTGNNLLFIVLSCLLAGIVVSGVFSTIVLQGLKIELGLPDNVLAEQPVIAELRLKNTKRFFASFSVTISAQAPSRRRHAEHAPRPEAPILWRPIYIPYIRSRSSVSELLEFNFPKRGRHFQEGLRVSTIFPFGFIRKSRNVPSPQEVLVLPNPHATRPFHEALKSLGTEMEDYLQGYGHDLYAIRDYQKADPVRHIDWKSTARVQQLKVREFAREDECCISLVFDNQVPDAQQRTLQQFEKAVTLCACFAWHFSEAGASMRFVTGGFEIPMSPASAILHAVLERLAVIEPLLERSPQLDRFVVDSSIAAHGFRIILTYQADGSLSEIVPDPLHVVSIESL